MEKEEFARSGDKLFESSLLRQNEFTACALLCRFVDFKQPDVDSLNKLTGNPLDRMQRHLALAKDRITSVARQAETSVKSTGQVKTDVSQEATIEIVSVIRDDLLADALDIERKYSAFYKNFWESIKDAKQEEASTSLTTAP